MKLYLVMLLAIALASTKLYAQYNWITQLPCDTWGDGESKFSFESVYQENKYKYSTPGVTSENYISYDSDWSTSFWTPHTEMQYVNNVQIIRWDIKDYSIKYRLSISNLMDVEIYNEEINTCAVLINLDSIRGDFFGIKLKPINETKYPPQWISKRHDFSMYALANEKRSKVLEALNGCTTLNCKVDLLVKEQLFLDAMSLLEVEKMKSSSDEIDSMYWKVASMVRLSWLYLSMER